MDETISQASEDHININVESTDDVSPVSIDSFIQNNIQVWKN